MTATTQAAGCPPWCTVPIQEHLAERPEWEGGDIHRCTVLWGDPTGRQAACRPEKVFMAGMGSEEDRVLIYADLHPEDGMTPAQGREVAAALLRAADLLDGRVEGPEVRWDAGGQTYIADCSCGWRYFASTPRHAEVRASEHTRDDH